MACTGSVFEICTRAKAASSILAQKSNDERNQALYTMADALVEHSPKIEEANAQDVAAAKEKGTSESLIDRLYLDGARIADMASALRNLAKLPDPLGRMLEHRTLYNGLDLTRVSVPLGLVGIIYEARPNVTCDAAGICLKSGNSCVLRGGSLAVNSNNVIAEILSQAVAGVGFPAECISWLSGTDRKSSDDMMALHGVVDVIVPRGGAGLIAHCVETSKVPVIETGTGNCHVYIHESADIQMATDIIVNAKCRRYGVCNAAETLLVDKAVAHEALASMVPPLRQKGVLLHCDELSDEICASMGLVENQDYVRATEKDWETEYLSKDLAVKCLENVKSAVEHINLYGTGHSEAIIANDAQSVELFLNEVDAACVYVNASTAFTDGGQFGLGAEIGISTQKLHVRGPFALEALTSSKYIIRGSGQVRS